MRSNKGFLSLVLLVVLAVAAIGGGGYYLIEKNKVELVESNLVQPAPTPEATAPNPEPPTPVETVVETPPTPVKPLVPAPVSVASKPVDTSACVDLDGQQKYRCLKKAAIASGSVALCATLPNTPEALRDNCYVEVAPVLKDYSICEKIRVIGADDAKNYAKPHNYYNCRMFTSIALNDLPTCRLIENKEGLQKLEQEQRGYGVDEQSIQESLNTERESYRSLCTFAIALKTKNVNTCSFLPEIADDLFSKTSCVYAVNQCIADPKSCENPLKP